MRPQKKNLLGLKFGNLTCITSTKKGWLCKCICGKEKDIYAYNLISGKTNSCGCKRLIRTHGKTYTRAYSIWCSMKKRATNINSQRYKDYAGRGITICQRWLDFSNFLADMGEPPKDYSIERIDNSKGYCPENCKWASMTEQSRNKRNNTFIEFKGIKKTIIEWSEITGISAGTLSYRVRHGATENEYFMSKLEYRKRLNKC
jgi:hypothetical protein